MSTKLNWNYEVKWVGDTHILLVLRRTDNEDLVNESIDIIIDLTKGKFDINRVAKCSANCVPKLISCFPRVASIFKCCKK
mgnify:CR=1 FL=1